MMPSSWKRQQQTQSLSKTRRFAPRTARHTFRFIRTPNKRLTIVALGIVASLGVPALVLATHQQYSQVDAGPEASSPDQLTPQKTSSTDEEVFSSSSVNIQMGSTTQPLNEIVGHAVINGEIIPLTNDSSTTRHIDGDSNSVDVDISVKDGDTSTSISSSSSTEVRVESNSSTSEETNETRGSPRR